MQAPLRRSLPSPQTTSRGSEELSKGGEQDGGGRVWRIGTVYEMKRLQGCARDVLYNTIGYFSQPD